VTASAGVALIALAVGCANAGDAERATTPSDWPATVRFDRLQLSHQELLEQTFSLRPPPFDLRDPDLVRHGYGVRGPNGHGFATEVFYLPKQGRFFMRSDCGQGHYDNYLGPFAGDPRVVLAP
jgi:hypothetical protein